MRELEVLACRPETAREIMDTLISGLLFSVRCDTDRRFSASIFKNARAGGPDNPGLDELAFRCCMPRVLSGLDDITETLRQDLQKAARAVGQKLPAEELLIVLLSPQSPGWLCKALLAAAPIRDLLGRGACAPYFCLAGEEYNPAGEKQKIAEMQRVYAQAEKVLRWFQKCPPEYLPPALDNYPPEMQDCAARRLAKTLTNWPMDKILGLISAEYLPAWLRRAAEIAFSGRAPLLAAARAARVRRKRRGKMG